MYLELGNKCQPNREWIQMKYAFIDFFCRHDFIDLEYRKRQSRTIGFKKKY